MITIDLLGDEFLETVKSGDPIAIADNEDLRYYAIDQMSAAVEGARLSSYVIDTALPVVTLPYLPVHADTTDRELGRRAPAPDGRTAVSCDALRERHTGGARRHG